MSDSAGGVAQPAQVIPVSANVIVAGDLVVPEERVTGTHLPLSTVEMVVRCVLDAATSLRGASGVFEIAQRVLCGEDQPGPSHVTVRNLLLRLGLYEVVRPKEFAADWLWIVDHTIQAGTTKCFVVLGIRHRDFLLLNRPLKHHDLQMLALIPVETSTGAIVHKQLNSLANACGVPLAILSDRGSDLVLKPAYFSE